MTPVCLVQEAAAVIIYVEGYGTKKLKRSTGNVSGLNVILHTSLSFFCAMSLLSLSTKYRAAHVMRTPWPRSPNITANRKGKVMMVYGAEGNT